MARKRKQGAFEDLIDIAAMLPWWVGVLLALITYLVLHHYATSEIAQPMAVAQLGANVASQLGKTLALFGQYLVPLAFIMGAGISAYGRHKRAGLFADVQQGSSPSVLNGMSWREFEMLVGEAFRRGGYAVTETGGGGADGGVDLVLRKDGEKFLVQCKQWKALNVGVTVVRELNGVMAAGGAVGGFVVTSGTFSSEAIAFAKATNITLIDGDELTKFIKEISPSAFMSATAVVPQISPAAAKPNCPRCGSTMIRRTARQGANAGNMFWGCSNYPQCKGIVPIN